MSSQVIDSFAHNCVFLRLIATVMQSVIIQIHMSKRVMHGVLVATV